MTTLSIFQPEIVTIETQLTALQTQLDELRQAEDIATQLLSTLADTLPRFEKLGAIARIKEAVMGMFGETDAPNFQNFMTEVPAATEPTSEEIFDAEVLPHTPEQAESRVEEKTEQMNYVELVELTPTLSYQRKHDGEIVCAYLGCVNQKLAKDWAECLVLWGCRAEVRKAKRLTGADIKYEVKIWNASIQQLDRVAANHTSPFQSVPAPQTTRQAPEKKNETAPNPSALNGGATSDEKNDADNAAPQVSLVMGKADNIYLSYFVMEGRKTYGQVQRLSAEGKWSIAGMPGTWDTAEEAADALIAKREADKKLHDDTNAVLRAKYGLPV